MNGLRVVTIWQAELEFAALLESDNHERYWWYVTDDDPRSDNPFRYVEADEWRTKKAIRSEMRKRGWKKQLL